MSEYHDADYGLVFPFLTDDPAFCQGVEVGMLHEQMKRRRKRITGYYLMANQEQITLMANRLGWTIIHMEPRDQDPDGWFFLDMRRKEKRT